jgi:hypothetical protein
MDRLLINKKIEKYIKKLNSSNDIKKINRYQKRLRLYRRYLVELNNKNESSESY